MGYVGGGLGESDGTNIGISNTMGLACDVDSVDGDEAAEGEEREFHIDLVLNYKY